MEKRNITRIVLLLLSQFGFSQKHIIIDSITKEPVPFVAIKNIKNYEGFYTNEKGFFSLNEKTEDTLQISCLGYKTIIESINKLNDTILFIPEVIELDEIILNKVERKKIVLGLKRKKLNFYMNPNFQIGLLLIPSKDFIDKYIDNITIPINKKLANGTKGNEKFKSVFKVNLYSNEIDTPKLPLLEKPINIIVDQNSEDFVTLDLSEYFIEFSKEGIFICLEMVGEINDNGEVINSKNPRPSFVFSNKPIKEFSSKSFFRTKFSNKWDLLSIEKFHLKEDIFLAINITLSTYD